MIKAIAMSLGILLSCAVYGQDVSYDSLNKEGFGDVAKLLQSMPPEQRAEVFKQAGLQQQKLQNMSPEQRQALEEQLRSIADTIDMQKVDPAKLDPSKVKPVGTETKNMNTYQQKYDKRQINNPVVRQPDSSDGQ